MLCFEYDGYNGDGTFWTATLNNGKVVYQDDGRECYEEPSTWLRLIEYCKANSLYIIEFNVRFRDHVEHLPSNAEGYFFSKGCAAIWGDDTSYNQYVMGYLEDNTVKITKWVVPAIIPMEKVNRDYETCKHLVIKRE